MIQKITNDARIQKVIKSPMIQRIIKSTIVSLAFAVIVYIIGYPMLKGSTGGHLGDLLYHLLRIESVKDALAAGSFPARVNPIYFEGYGYGTSLFYPDIFLVIPAVLNLMGVSTLMSYRLFMLLVILLATCTTYYAMKFFCHRYEVALLGTGMLMLSTFYVADINFRSGMSEAIAFIFLPLLFVGIYDYFALEGKRVYLLGIAFGGMLLSHTIMTFIGVVLTIIIFVGMLFVPAKRKVLFEKKRFGRLLLTACLTVLAVSYYVFPMLEQMASDKFWYNESWAKVGKYTQSIESLFLPMGDFFYNARFGVGVPILVLISGRVFLGKARNKWANLFYGMGVLQFVIMTDVLFWVMMQDTIMNMIQFPYRFYPYALFMVICGVCIVLVEKIESGQVGKWALVFLAVLTVACGFWESDFCYQSGRRELIDREYLYENTCSVGMGEWVPEGVPEEVLEGDLDAAFATDGTEPVLTDLGYNDYQFEVGKSMGQTIVAPLLYYKGYAAQLIAETGEPKELTVSKSQNGLVQIHMEQASEGAVRVWYKGTMIQTLSNILSCMTMLAVCAIGIYTKIKKRKCEKSELKA